MKYANKLGAAYSVILGEDELTAQKVQVKNMENGEIITCKLNAQALAMVMTKN